MNSNFEEMQIAMQLASITSPTSASKPTIETASALKYAFRNLPKSTVDSFHKFIFTCNKEECKDYKQILIDMEKLVRSPIVSPSHASKYSGVSLPFVESFKKFEIKNDTLIYATLFIGMGLSN